jgi:hypothetical protein
MQLHPVGSDHLNASRHRTRDHIKGPALCRQLGRFVTSRWSPARVDEAWAPGGT